MAFKMTYRLSSLLIQAAVFIGPLPFSITTCYAKPNHNRSKASLAIFKGLKVTEEENKLNKNVNNLNVNDNRELQQFTNQINDLSLAYSPKIHRGRHGSYAETTTTKAQTRQSLSSLNTKQVPQTNQSQLNLVRQHAYQYLAKDLAQQSYFGGGKNITSSSLKGQQLNGIKILRGGSSIGNSNKKLLESSKTMKTKDQNRDLNKDFVQQALNNPNSNHYKNKNDDQTISTSKEGPHTLTSYYNKFLKDANRDQKNQESDNDMKAIIQSVKTDPHHPLILQHIEDSNSNPLNRMSSVEFNNQNKKDNLNKKKDSDGILTHLMNEEKLKQEKLIKSEHSYDNIKTNDLRLSKVAAEQELEQEGVLEQEKKNKVEQEKKNREKQKKKIQKLRSDVMSGKKILKVQEIIDYDKNNKHSDSDSEVERGNNAKLKNSNSGLVHDVKQVNNKAINDSSQFSSYKATETLNHNGRSNSLQTKKKTRSQKQLQSSNSKTSVNQMIEERSKNGMVSPHGQDSYVGGWVESQSVTESINRYVYQDKNLNLNLNKHLVKNQNLNLSQVQVAIEPLPSYTIANMNHNNITTVESQSETDKIQKNYEKLMDNVSLKSVSDSSNQQLSRSKIALNVERKAVHPDSESDNKFVNEQQRHVNIKSEKQSESHYDRSTNSLSGKKSSSVAITKSKQDKFVKSNNNTVNNKFTIEKKMEKKIHVNDLNAAELTESKYAKSKVIFPHESTNQLVNHDHSKKNQKQDTVSDNPMAEKKNNTNNKNPKNFNQNPSEKNANSTSNHKSDLIKEHPNNSFSILDSAKQFLGFKI